MFDWLLDDFWVIAFLLCVGLAGFSTAWWRTRKKQYAIGAGVFVLLLGIYIALHFLIETSSQQMERRVSDMAASVERKDIGPTLERHLADDFHAGSHDKKGFSERAQDLAGGHHVDKVTVWQFKLVEIDREKKTATLHFMAKPITPGQENPWYLVKAQFVMTSKEGWSEEWKMKSFEYFNPIADTKSPLPIP